MSNTRKDKRARDQRQANPGGPPELSPDFDGRRYGNKRKAVADLKKKDRRRTNRAARRNLEEFETPLKRKHILEC